MISVFMADQQKKLTMEFKCTNCKKKKTVPSVQQSFCDNGPIWIFKKKDKKISLQQFMTARNHDSQEAWKEFRQ